MARLTPLGDKSLEVSEDDWQQGSRPSVVNNVQLDIRHSQIGNVAQTAGAHSSAILQTNDAFSNLTQAGHPELATALKNITDCIASTEELAERTKKDILESLMFITEQAALPSAKRQEGLVRAVLSGLESTVQVVGSLGQVWDTYGAVVLSFFQNH